MIFDYSATENNCFILKHKLKDNVLSVIIDEDKITINYSEYFAKIVNGYFIEDKENKLKIIPENKLILEEYDKFGILKKSTEYYNLDVINQTDNSITYSYKDTTIIEK